MDDERRRSRYQIETTLPNGTPITVPIPDEFLDMVIAQHMDSLALEPVEPVDCPNCN